MPKRRLTGDKRQDLPFYSSRAVVVNSICNVIQNILCYVTEKEKWLWCRGRVDSGKKILCLPVMMITMNWKEVKVILGKSEGICPR